MSEGFSPTEANHFGKIPKECFAKSLPNAMQVR
jgi:hypothetical protein